MIPISIAPSAGRFAENKDMARDIRMTKIVPAMENGQKITLDFGGVDSATHSFIHALLSDVIRVYGREALDRISFQACAPSVQKLIGIVVDYTQEDA